MEISETIADEMLTSDASFYCGNKTDTDAESHGDNKAFRLAEGNVELTLTNKRGSK